MKASCTILFLILMLCMPINVFAEDNKVKGKQYELKEIVVTESKIPLSQEQITHKVDVLTSDELQNFIYSNRNIAEALRYLPGNFVNPLSRNDANWGSYGGLGPKYNVYYLDGLPVDSFVDAMSLDTIYLSRIEVHRGAASVLYPNYMTMDFAGNETPLAGITNLITKDKIAVPKTIFSIGYGTWNTINGRIYHEGSTGPFNYFLGANYEQSDYTNYGTEPSWLNMIDDPEYRKAKLFMKGTYFFNDNSKLSLFAHHTQHTGDAGRPNRDYNHQYDVINVIFQKDLTSDLDLSVKVGYRYYHRRWEDFREYEDGVKQNIFPVDIYISYKHLRNSVFTVGTDFQFVKYETYSEPTGTKEKGNDVDAYNYRIYAEEKLVIDRWVLRLGGQFSLTKHKYDLIGGVKPEIKSKSWNRFLWSAGVRYNISEKIAIYSNAGASFLTPSAKSIGGTLKESDRGVPGRNGQLPNPGLKPEKGLSFDLGTDIWLMSNLNFGIRGFYNIVDDAIVTNRVSENPSQSQDVNAGKSKAYGAEVELSHQATKDIGWFINATFTKSKVKNNVDPDSDGTEIPFVPKFIANAGMSLRLPCELEFYPYVQYVGKYYDSTSKSGRKDFGDYFVANAKLVKGLFKGEKYSSKFILEINNIFNKKYEMPWQFQDPGFNMMGRIEFVF